MPVTSNKRCCGFRQQKLEKVMDQEGLADEEVSKVFTDPCVLETYVTVCVISVLV